jgi:hypothetical protein
MLANIGDQWRVGPSGPYALDYNVLFHELDRYARRHKLSDDEYDELLAQIQVAAEEALDEMQPPKKPGQQ